MGEGGYRGARRRWACPWVVAVVCLAVVAACTSGGEKASGGGAPTTKAAKEAKGAATTTTTTRKPSAGGEGQPFKDAKVQGLLTFRGNPMRNYYGQGPVPKHPRVLWSFPKSAMCSQSSDIGGTFSWCGSGWTGEPAVVERGDKTWAIFGAYDRAVHFLDAATGERLLPDFPTGDLIKGSVSVDPEGFPLIYIGSRDNNFRVISIDRGKPTELWRLNANDVKPTLWNDDWDGSGLVIGDYLFEGGENSQWHVVKLNRAMGPDGFVTVRPQLVFHAPGWDDELLRAIGDHTVSIENSVAIWRDTIYFANSGGLVQGWDIGGLATGRMPTRVFRFWTGDDTDASVVVDDEGMLYVGSEWERHNARSRQVGQIMKLDPEAANPLVWSIPDQGAAKAGIWSTAGLHRDVVIEGTNLGRLLGIDRKTGAIRWTKNLPAPLWQSPVIVDDVLIEGDCAGDLHAYDVSNTAVDPPELWKLHLGGCIEATPAVWKGRLYLGTRGGLEYGIGD